MPLNDRLKHFLEERGAPYEIQAHAEAFTAQEIAHAAHVSGKILVKAVMVMAGDRLIMTVLPADHEISLSALGRLLGTSRVRLATEEEFKDLFPECEVGAMPPLGNIYHMDVWIDEKLKTYPIISFNAGTHAEIIQMSFADFERLVQPKTASFGVLLH